MPKMQQVRGVATTVTRDGVGVIRVRYHNTDVVVFNDEWIRLYTGGWYTATTKTRMNQASREFGLGYHVFQKDFVWYVLKDDDVGVFQEGMIIWR